VGLQFGANCRTLMWMGMWDLRDHLGATGGPRRDLSARMNFFFLFYYCINQVTANRNFVRLRLLLWHTICYSLEKELFLFCFFFWFFCFLVRTPLPGEPVFK